MNQVYDLADEHSVKTLFVLMRLLWKMSDKLIYGHNNQEPAKIYGGLLPGLQKKHILESLLVVADTSWLLPTSD